MSTVLPSLNHQITVNTRWAVFYQIPVGECRVEGFWAHVGQAYREFVETEKENET